MRLGVLICRKHYPCGALEALATPASAVKGSLGLDSTWRGSLGVSIFGERQKMEQEW